VDAVARGPAEARTRPTRQAQRLSGSDGPPPSRSGARAGTAGPRENRRENEKFRSFTNPRKTPNTTPMEAAIITSCVLPRPGWSCLRGTAYQGGAALASIGRTSGISSPPYPDAFALCLGPVRPHPAALIRHTHPSLLSDHRQRLPRRSVDNRAAAPVFFPGFHGPRQSEGRRLGG